MSLFVRLLLLLWLLRLLWLSLRSLSLSLSSFSPQDTNTCAANSVFLLWLYVRHNFSSLSNPPPSVFSPLFNFLPLLSLSPLSLLSLLSLLLQMEGEKYKMHGPSSFLLLREFRLDTHSQTFYNAFPSSYSSQFSLICFFSIAAKENTYLLLFFDVAGACGTVRCVHIGAATHLYRCYFKGAFLYKSDSISGFVSPLSLLLAVLHCVYWNRHINYVFLSPLSPFPPLSLLFSLPLSSLSLSLSLKKEHPPFVMKAN